MSLDLVQDIVDRLPADRSICWTWHGGECSTVPVEWFEKACEIIRSRFDLNISMVMQSNGYDVPDEFLKMCIRNSIHIGFSYDFDTQATRSGNADVDPVADTLDRSRKLGIHTGAITVIHNKNVHKMVDYYEAAKTRWNYTPAFNHVFSSPNASKYNISLNEDSYWTHFRKFANHVIYDKDLDATVERTFEVGIQTVIGLPAALCSFSNCSYVYICIDPVGRCLPCDRTYPASGLVLDTSNITQSTGPVGDESHVDLIFKLNWTANNPVSVNTPIRLIIDGRTVHFTDLDMTILNHVDQTPDEDEGENEGSTGNEGNGSGSVGGNEGTQKPDSSKPSDKEDENEDKDKDEKPVKLKVFSLRDIGEEIEAMAKGDVLELELGDKNAISSEILNLIKDSSKTLSFVNDEADISYVWSIYGKDIRTTKFKDSSYSLLITPEDEGMFSSDLEDLLYEKCLILDFDIGSTRFTSQLAVKTDMRRKNVNIYQVIDEDEEILEWVGKTKSSNKGTVEFETDEYGTILLTTETLPREYVVNYEDSINYKEPSKEDQVVDSEETTDVTVGENTITLPNSVINSDGSVNIGDKTYTTEELAAALENGEITEEQIEDILDAELDGFLDMIEDLFGGLFEEPSSGSSEETTVRPGGQVSNAVTGGISAQILEDRAVDESGMPIAAVLAVVIFAAVSAAGVTIFIKKRSE